MNCQGKIVATERDPKTGRFEDKPCPNKSVTTRKNWRFGNRAKGEMLVVKVILHYCRECAERYDECVAEARAEGGS